MIQLPFYGGAKGSVLRFVKTQNGSLSTMVSPVSEESVESSEEHDNRDKVKDSDSVNPNQFSDNLLKIQKAASRLVAIQQVVKASGKISDEEKQTYAVNLESLGQAAQALAKINEGTDEGDDDFRTLISGENNGDTFSGPRTCLILDYIIYCCSRRQVQRQEGNAQEQVPRLPALQAGDQEQEQ